MATAQATFLEPPDPKAKPRTARAAAEPQVEPAAPAEAGIPWSCTIATTLHCSGAWWLSKHNVVLCQSCQPPALPELVWASGDAASAPLVEVGRTSTPAKAQEWKRS
jgi:hypothetical protein